MGMFTRLFSSQGETSEQKKQRIVREAMESDDDIRLYLHFHQIVNTWMNDCYSQYMSGDIGEIIDMHLLIEFLARSTNTTSMAIDAQENAPSNTQIALPTGRIITYAEFCKTVGSRRISLLEQIAQNMVIGFSDNKSAYILNKSKDHYYDPCIRGFEKVVALFEQNGFQEDASSIRNGVKQFKLPPLRWLPF